MDRHQKEFDTRLRRIDRKHRKMSSGYVASVGHDGLIVARPRTRRIRVPYLGIAILLVGLVALKGLFYANLGAETYDARVAALSEGSTVEKAGAWVMHADPLTLWVAGQIGPVLD